MTQAARQAFNPILPSWEYVADPEPRVFGSRLYIYGSHDRFDGNDFCLNDYVCWSAPLDDLGNWEYGGVLYSPKQDPLNADGSQCGFAPDLICGPDGRYYLFYCLSRTSAVSVAVSESPAGPFSFYGHVRHEDGGTWGIRPGDPFCFDPGVFRDEDGRIWLYVGFAPSGMMRTMMKNNGLLVDGSYCVELSDDLLTIKSAPSLVVPAPAVAEGTGFEGHAFYEASSPRRIGRHYYLVYSSEKSHELCFAVSDSPDGGFTYGGTIISNGDVGLSGAEDAVNYTGNIHGGMVLINGQWYIFYHRQTNRQQFSRQCCAEPITIGADGKITQAELTSCALNGKPLAGLGRYEARIACNLSSASGTYFYKRDESQGGAHPYFTQSSPDREENGDQFIANMRDGAWAGFKYFSLGEAAHITLQARGNFTGSVTVSTERNGPSAALVDICPSEEWALFTAPLNTGNGIYGLYLTCRGEGAMDLMSFTLE